MRAYPVNQLTATQPGDWRIIAVALVVLAFARVTLATEIPWGIVTLPCGSRGQW